MIYLQLKRANSRERTPLDLITLDYETYWSPTYSLSCMSPLQYVQGTEFEVISCAIKVNDEPTYVVFGDAEVRAALECFTWNNIACLAHNNSGFDAYVTAYHYGIKPKLWLCSMAMARPLHAKGVGLSLGKLVAHYKRGVKDNTVLLQTKGRRLADFTSAEVSAMATYNAQDTEQCYAIFNDMKPHFTQAELWQIDAITRMRTEPAFELDTGILLEAASSEATRKHNSLMELAKQLKIENTPWDDEDAVVTLIKAELASAPRFSQLLVELGAEVPMKPSPSNENKMIPALAKTDEGLQELQEHDNPVVAAAARARLDVKSTLLETRIQKFLTAGSMADGFLPVPLRYCGADTTGRDSGEEYNCQNLPRIIHGVPRPTDALRNSLRAPKGKLVIVADQSGIELRVNHFLWKVADSMAMFQASPDKADLYKSFAADVLFHVEQSEISKHQRQTGKVAQLGLGFGSGAATFKVVAKNLGNVILPVGEHDRKEGDTLTCEGVVTAWRDKYQDIVQGWRTCGRALAWISQGMARAVDPWGLVHTSKYGYVLPSGRLIRYPDMREEADGEWPDGRARTSWFYAQGRHKTRITGPKADENIVQALARDSVFDCTLEFYKRTGLRPAMRLHDELVYVVDEGKAQELLDELQSVMRTPPAWWPQLVVWSEGDAAETYGAAK